MSTRDTERLAQALGRPITRRRALQVFGATAAATAATAVAGSVSATALRAPAAGRALPDQEAPTGVIRFGAYEGGLADGLVPWYSFGQEFVWNWCAQKLIQVAPDGSVVYDLAASHEVSDDGLTYTFKLVDGATWSDGTPVTADDVAFTYNTMLKTDAGSNSAFKLTNLVGADEVTADQTKDASGIQVIDPQTISFTFTTPGAGYLSQTFGTSFIAPKHAFEGMDLADYKTNPAFTTGYIGSGPYTITEFKQDESVALVANPNYVNGSGYSGAPKAAQVAIRMFADANAQVLAAEAGEIDFTYYRQPSGDILSRFRAIQGMNVLDSFVGFNVFYSIPYVDRPWATKEFRQALAYATDRVTMAQINGGSAPSAIISDWTAPWAVSDQLEPYTYDIEKAKAALAASGFDLNQELDVRIYPYGVTPDEIPVLLDTWRNELGLKLKERAFTSDGFIKEFYEDSDYDIGFVYGFGTLDGSPFGSGQTLLSTSLYPNGYNSFHFANEEFDTEYLAGNAAITQEEQGQHFARASEIFNAELPYFPYFNRVDAAIVSSKLTGVEGTTMFHPSAGGVPYWEWGIAS